ncbi:hypothetical protein [Chitinibacter sp. S2-10]|uniref:HD domain-containing protein n=1 Tax=Chitinibacter sp. S2-10 TaxID=3373597 RepID=UPI00397744FB
MNISKECMEPLETWLQENQKKMQFFPHGKSDYFDRYWLIKDHLANSIYPYIAAGTSAEDGGIYTDHSIDHFNAVIRITGKLLGIPDERENAITAAISLNPYEVYITLVSILLHDAGNINGRRGHEKHPLKIFTQMGAGLCPDQFEAKPIADIAQAHGGKTTDIHGNTSKDTLSNLKEEDTYAGKKYRPKLIASLVRFADEICEDRSRAARYLLSAGTLPKKSEIFHHYANSISSVDIDLRSKWVNIKYEILEKDILNQYGKDNGEGGHSDCYLIDEINSRLEKMFCEMIYCKSHMIEAVHINQIRANIIIYSQTDGSIGEIACDKRFELKESGYPADSFTFKSAYPDWCGDAALEILTKFNEAKS